MVKKIYAYGMDGFITPMMKFFAEEGTFPNLPRHVRAVNRTHLAFPVLGTHRVSNWQIIIRANQLGKSFQGRANNAERIWNAVGQARLKGVTDILSFVGQWSAGAEPRSSDPGSILRLAIDVALRPPCEEKNSV